MAAPRPTPTHLRLIQGNRQKRPLNKSEPKPRGDLCDPPESLSDAAKVVWHKIITDAPRGLLKRLDSILLVMYCNAAVIYDDAVLRVAKYGSMTKSPNGVPIQNPYLAVVNKQALIMIKLAQEMGFTPSARSRVTVDPDHDTENAASEFGL